MLSDAGNNLLFFIYLRFRLRNKNAIVICHGENILVVNRKFRTRTF